MSFTWNPDSVTVIVLELTLLMLVGCALDRDGRPPVTQGVRWARCMLRSRSEQKQSPQVATEPLMAMTAAKAQIEGVGVVQRGSLTMGLITGSYATTLGASYAILDSASGLEGCQAALMTLNTLLLGYLFFFSGWWRNRILLPLKQRIQRD